MSFLIPESMATPRETDILWYEIDETDESCQILAFADDPNRPLETAELRFTDPQTIEAKMTSETGTVTLTISLASGTARVTDVQVHVNERVRWNPLHRWSSIIRKSNRSSQTGADNVDGQKRRLAG